MTTAIKIKITSFIDSHQPGFVEGRFIDAWNKEHIVRDKVPIFTEEHLDESSDYPREGFVACEIIKTWNDSKGREIKTVNTEKPWGIESIDAIKEFDLLTEQITSIE